MIIINHESVGGAVYEYCICGKVKLVWQEHEKC